MKSPRTPALRVVYWVATALVAVAFVVPGVMHLVRAPHVAQDMAHLGYPSYVLGILGTWKILGAVAIVAPGVPRLKEWAYAGMMFDLTGAAVSRAVSGDGASMVIAPLLVAFMVLLSWRLRPTGRTLRDAAQGVRS
jgi:uncharacterized membrane protein YphA (DoxX/SURF4 family)